MMLAQRRRAMRTTDAQYVNDEAGTLADSIVLPIALIGISARPAKAAIGANLHPLPVR
jgi:hypothetical protein